MGWKEAQSRYQTGRTLADQGTEDLVARRVLRGLGLVQATLPKLERSIFGSADFDEALWPRTKRLLSYALISEGHAAYANGHDFEVYESDGKLKDIMERLEMVPADRASRPVFMTRIKNSTTSVTYSLWDKSTLETIAPIPPFSVSTEVGSSGLKTYWLVIQDTEHYVKQFMTGGFKSAAERNLSE